MDTSLNLDDSYMACDGELGLPLGFLSPTLNSILSPQFSEDTSFFSINNHISKRTGSPNDGARISPMITPVKNPFAASFPRPMPLVMENSKAFFNPTSPVAESHSSSWASKSFLDNIDPRTSNSQELGMSHSEEEVDEVKEVPSMDCMANMDQIPEPYRDIRFFITTYRWKPVQDRVFGVPVVEIRPYNKSDGKRYVYIHLDGLQELARKAMIAGLPMPKGRFQVERCSDGASMGTLTTKEPTEDALEEEDQLVDLSENMTLLMSERIVKQLDREGIGRGSPPPKQHKLRVVVSIVAQQIQLDVDICVLPFFRIKRRQKKRTSVTEDIRPARKKSRSLSFQGEVNSDTSQEWHTPAFPYTSREPQPMINTAPNSQHFVDFFCATCGPSQSVMLIEAADISFINVTGNEVWANAATNNCSIDMQRDDSSLSCRISCRNCMTVLGTYYSNPNEHQIEAGRRSNVFQFTYVDPRRLEPLLYYKPSSTHQNAPRYLGGSVREGWVGWPLLESEFPEYLGAYASVASAQPIAYPYTVLGVDSKPEAKLFDMIHSLPCDSDAAWTLRNLLPKQDRMRSLSKLALVMEMPQIRHLMQNINAETDQETKTRFYDLVCQSVFGNGATSYV